MILSVGFLLLDNWNLIYFRRVQNIVTKKLRCLLSMLGSKMKIESSAIDCGGNQPDYTANMEKDTGTLLEMLQNVENKRFHKQTNNNDKDKEIEIVTILPGDIPPQRKRTQTLISPALSSSTFKSSTKSLSPRNANHLTQPKECGWSVRQSGTVMESGSDIDVDDLLQDTDTSREKRSVAVSTDATLKKENLDLGYESLLAPAVIRSEYDATNGVEIIGVGNGSQSLDRPKPSSFPSKNVSKTHKKQVYPCAICKRVLGNKGAWKTHSLACNSKRQEKKKTIIIIIKKRKELKFFTCLSCQEIFPNQKKMVEHKKKQKSCQTTEPPFKCSSCIVTFDKKVALRDHLGKSCPYMKARKNAMQNYDFEVENEDNYENFSDSDGDNDDDYDSGDNDDDNEDDEHLVTTGQGDLEYTLDEYVSCKGCGGKPFTHEKFERHQQQTGHRGETFRPPTTFPS